MIEQYLTTPGNWINGVDLEIKELLLDLNRLGFTSVLSCAGHPFIETGYSYPPGYIVFAGIFNTREAGAIMARYGLTDLRWSCDNHFGAHLIVEFTPIGEHRHIPARTLEGEELIPGEGVHFPTPDEQIRMSDYVDAYCNAFGIWLVSRHLTSRIDGKNKKSEGEK